MEQSRTQAKMSFR